MALTDAKVKNAKWSGKTTQGDKLSDGGGLYLYITPAGGKLWRMAYRFNGKQRTLALGSYPAMTLGQARKARDAAKKLIDEGIDPSLHKMAQKQQAAAQAENTFEAIAAEWFRQWKTDKAAHTIDTKWTRLESDIFPHFGKLPIADITTPMIVTAVRAVHARGARDAAERVQGTCSQVFRYAIAHGMAERNPAADIRAGDILPARKVRNHARVDARQLPDLLRDIYSYKGEAMTTIGLQLLCLTFVRTSELVGARWEELDLQAGRWEIPAERMKMDSPHIVPLSPQAVALFRQLHAMHGQHPHVFYSSRSKARHMSEGTMLQALYRLGYRGTMTGHGFRGLASTILHESGFPHEHIEAQLAHQKRNKVSAAYDHSKYLAQRAELMNWWGNYVENCTSDKIVTMPRRSA